MECVLTDEMDVSGTASGQNIVPLKKKCLEFTGSFLHGLLSKNVPYSFTSFLGMGNGILMRERMKMKRL